MYDRVRRAARIEELKQTLSADESRRASRFHLEAHRGHYIVAYAFDAARDRFLYADPCVSAERSWIEGKALERARKAHGTDEDVLVMKMV